MLDKTREFLSGGLTENGAKEIYLKLNEEIHDHIKNLERYNFPSISFVSKEEPYTQWDYLNETKLVELIPRSLKKKIEKFFKDLKNCEGVYEKCSKSIRNTLFKFVKKDAHTNPENVMPWFINSILNKKFNFLTKRKDIFEVTGKDVQKMEEDIKENELIKKLDTSRENLIKEGQSLRKEIIKQYNNSIKVSEIRKTTFTLCTIFLTIGLVAATLWMAHSTKNLADEQIKLVNKQVEIAQNQMQLYEESLIPNKPAIYIFPEDDNELILNAGHLADISYDGKKYEVSHERVEFIIQNRGRFDTGPVNIALENEWSNRGHAYIPNVLAGKSEITEIKLRYNQCSGDKDSLEECKEEYVPKGWQNMTLTVKCSYCDELINKIVEVCIWGRDYPHINCSK